MIREILKYPNPELKKKSLPVDKIDDEIKELVKDMVETMYDAPGIGLAAPQVGVHKRVIVIDIAKKDEPSELIVAINPEIVEASEEELFEDEGCLSVPSYTEDVYRYTKIKVKALDADGATQEIDAEGILAVAFQHEIDHLDGKLFVDHLSPLKKGIFRKKYKKIMEEEG